MLQTHSHGDTLRLDVHSRGIQVPVHVTCRVSGRQNHRSAHRMSLARLYTHNLSLLNDESVHARLKVHLSATAADGLAHVLNHTRQFVRTDVRVRITQDRGRCPMLAKHVQNLLHAATLLAARVEFAIRVGTGTPLTEAIVTLRVHRMFARDACDVPFACVHILTALHYDGSASQLDESQRSKESARSGPHHNHLRALIHHRVVGLHILIVGRQFVDI